MTKTTGLGDNFYYGGYDLSGDTNSLQSIHGGFSTWESTGIDKFAHERLALLRDGGIKWTSYFNPDLAKAHDALSPRITTDRIATYCRGTTLGNAGACLISKQINYDPTRGQDGSLTIDVEAMANEYGLEWGQQLTAGLRTDTGATNGTSVDTTGSLAFGAQAYLQVTGFAGTDATISVQDSANDIAFTDVTGLVFTAVTAAPFAERKATSNAATIRRYLRIATTTSAGFTSLTFNVIVVKNATAGIVF